MHKKDLRKRKFLEQTEEVKGSLHVPSPSIDSDRKEVHPSPDDRKIEKAASLEAGRLDGSR